MHHAWAAVWDRRVCPGTKRAHSQMAGSLTAGCWLLADTVQGPSTAWEGRWLRERSSGLRRCSRVHSVTQRESRCRAAPVGNLTERAGMAVWSGTELSGQARRMCAG